MLIVASSYVRQFVARHRATFPLNCLILKMRTVQYPAIAEGRHVFPKLRERKLFQWPSRNKEIALKTPSGKRAAPKSTSLMKAVNGPNKYTGRKMRKEVQGKP